MVSLTSLKLPVSFLPSKVSFLGATEFIKLSLKVTPLTPGAVSDNRLEFILH